MPSSDNSSTGASRDYTLPDRRSVRRLRQIRVKRQRTPANLAEGPAAMINRQPVALTTPRPPAKLAEWIIAKARNLGRQPRCAPRRLRNKRGGSGSLQSRPQAYEQAHPVLRNAAHEEPYGLPRISS